MANTRLITEKTNIVGSIPSVKIAPGNGALYETMADRVCIIICTNGKADITIGSKHYTIAEKFFIIIGPGKTFSIPQATENFRGDIYNIRIGILLVDELKNVYSLKRIYDDEPFRRIPEEKYIMCRFIGRYLKNFQFESDNIYFERIIKNYLNILFYEASNIFLYDNGKEKVSESKNRYLTNRFLADVESNFKTYRKVSFYAQRLGVTPKYLSSLVAKDTGHTATEWIDEYTLLEAKKMLHNKDMAIYQIAYELSFSTPSHFGMFFRKHTGLTPKEFIKSKEITSHNEAFPQE